MSCRAQEAFLKRPKGYYAGGKLIEDAELKGFRIGDALVSEKHAGLDRKSWQCDRKDVIMLIETIKHKVKEDTGVELEHEIKIVGGRMKVYKLWNIA